MISDDEIRGNKYFLYDYHKYRMPSGDVNPNKDRMTGLILDLKDDECRGHASAVQIFGKRLSNDLDEFLSEDEPVWATMVPSHEAGGLSTGLALVLRQVKARYNIRNGKNLLVRTRTINKLARGGDRSVAVHLDSIDVVDGGFPTDAKILLLDDVMTTGNSLMACEQLLYKAGAGLVIIIALAQTVDE